MVMEVPEGYKQTEVGIIPKDWTVSVVGQAFQIRNNLRLPISKKVRESMEGDYPYYGPTSIQGYINEYLVDGEYALIGEDGDHFLKWQSMPMTLLVSGKFNVNNHAHIVQGTENLTEWFYWYFYNRDITLYLSRQGAGRFKLNKATLQTLPCALPPTKKEQTAIATTLSDVDALITALKTLIEKKRQIKTATMQRLLTGKQRLPGFGEGKGMQQTELGEIPEDWEIKTIIEIADNDKKLFDDGDWVEAEHITDKGIRLVQTGNIGVGVFSEKGSKKFIYESSFHQLRCKELRVGDILICRLADPAGRACIFPDIDEEKVITSVDVTIFRPNIDKADRCFLVNVFSSDSWFKAIKLNVGGTTHQRISRGALGRISISFPPLKEQVEIAKTLKSMDNDIEMLETRLVKTQALKQGMMQELLTGRTRLL